MRYDIIDRETDQIVEGGFFSKDAAERSCADWNDAESVSKDRYYVKASRR
jgi:hypothetical protein